MAQDTAYESGRVFWLDDREVREFVAGRLDAAGEERLAGQVAALIFARKPLPNHVVANLSHIERHLGGGRGLLAWLSNFPGRPRFAARIAVVGDVLDRVSEDPEALGALRSYRERTPHPPGLDGYLIHATDETTLASLSSLIEHLVENGKITEAGQLAAATIAMLDEALRPAAERSAQIAAVLDTLAWARED